MQARDFRDIWISHQINKVHFLIQIFHHEQLHDLFSWRSSRQRIFRLPPDARTGGPFRKYICYILLRLKNTHRKHKLRSDITPTFLPIITVYNCPFPKMRLKDIKVSYPTCHMDMPCLCDGTTSIVVCENANAGYCPVLTKSMPGNPCSIPAEKQRSSSG